MAVALGLSAQSGAAEPVAGGAVPDLGTRSDNVSFIRNLPIGSGVGGRFAGGFYYVTAQKGGTYPPYAQLPGGLYVFDASVPEDPTLVSHMPLPVGQNEDVDLSSKRNILLIAMDNTELTHAPAACSEVRTNPQATQMVRDVSCGEIGGALFLIDIADPKNPRLASVLPLPGEISAGPGSDSPIDGPGHTATCVLGCTYAYLSGSDDGMIWVADLRDIDAPVLIGRFRTPAGAKTPHSADGFVHDVHEDRYGNTWALGTGGVAVYGPIKNPMKPPLIAASSPSVNAKTNQFILHGMLRFDRTTALIAEEDFGDQACGTVDPKKQDGAFQTWSVDTVKRRLSPVDSWDTETRNDPAYQAVTTVAGRDSWNMSCSSHWFDYNRHRVVADAWYEQGVRFLTIDARRRIKQVGYWVGPGAYAGQAQFHPARPDIVYVADYARGLDIVKIDRGGKGAKPVAAQPNREWFAPRADLTVEPHPQFGYACRIVRPA